MLQFSANHQTATADDPLVHNLWVITILWLTQIISANQKDFQLKVSSKYCDSTAQRSQGRQSKVKEHKWHKNYQLEQEILHELAGLPNILHMCKQKSP